MPDRERFAATLGAGASARRHRRRLRRRQRRHRGASLVAAALARPRALRRARRRLRGLAGRRLARRADGRRAFAPRRYAARAAAPDASSRPTTSPTRQAAGDLLVDARAAPRYQRRAGADRSESGARARGTQSPVLGQPDVDGAVPAAGRAARRAAQSCSAAASPSRLIAMCGSGVTACHLLLAMEVAGLARRAPLCRLMERVDSRPGAADQDRRGAVAAFAAPTATRAAWPAAARRGKDSCTDSPAVEGIDRVAPVP